MSNVEFDSGSNKTSPISLFYIPRRIHSDIFDENQKRRSLYSRSTKLVATIYQKTFIKLVNIDSLGEEYQRIDFSTIECINACSNTDSIFNLKLLTNWKVCTVVTTNKVGIAECYLKTRMTKLIPSSIRDTFLNPVAISRAYAIFPQFNGVSSFLVTLSSITPKNCQSVCDNTPSN